MAIDTLLPAAGAMFAAIIIAGAVATRVNQSVIPFYILAGILVNPFVLGSFGLPALTANEFVRTLAELGVVFLLFFLGLEFNLTRLLESRDRISKVGIVDLIVNFPIGVALGLLLGWTVIESFVLGGIVYISSSAVITKSLLDLGWIANPESEPMLGTLVFEDLFIALYLAVLSAAIVGGGSVTAVLMDVAVAIVFLLVLIAGVYYGSTAFERLLSVDSKEAFVLRAVGVTVLVAGVALAVGVSEAVAAFFIGMGFSDTEYVHELERQLTPLRDVFAAVFFFWIGLTTDPRLLVAVGGPLIIAVLLTTPTKLASGFYSGRLYKLSDQRSIRVACGMVTRGEFSLIIATLAATTGSGVVLTETIPALTVGYVLLMSILGTTLMQHAGRLERVADSSDKNDVKM